jgi:hypothetical protein
MSDFEPKTGKKRIYKASDFDDKTAVGDYRSDSQSTQKEDKDAAHYLSKGLAAAILNDYHRQGQRPDEEREMLKYVLNRPENLRMVMERSNRSNHKKLDHQIWSKAGDPDAVLNEEEKQRAIHAAKAIYVYHKLLDPSTLQCFSNFFKDLTFSCNVWDYVSK